MKYLLSFLIAWPLFVQAQEEWRPRPKKTTTVTEADLHQGKRLIGGVRYYIQIENAIEAGELLPPSHYRKSIVSASQPVCSVADELLKFRKLLDSGGITQQEYDAQKKKLLNQ